MTRNEVSSIISGLVGTLVYLAPISHVREAMRSITSDDELWRLLGMSVDNVSRSSDILCHSEKDKDESC